MRRKRTSRLINIKFAMSNNLQLCPITIAQMYTGRKSVMHTNNCIYQSIINSH